MNLDRIPSEVYSVLLGISAKNLDRPATPPPADPGIQGLTNRFDDLDTRNRAAVFGKDTKKDDIWVECEELIVFKAGENKIARLDREIGAFGGLKSIDVSGGFWCCLWIMLMVARLESVDCATGLFCRSITVDQYRSLVGASSVARDGT